MRDTRDLPDVYKNERTVIHSVKGDFCPACGEVILDREQGERYTQWMGAHPKRVNAF